MSLLLRAFFSLPPGRARPGEGKPVTSSAGSAGAAPTAGDRTIGAAGPKQSFAVWPSQLTTAATRPLVFRVSAFLMYGGTTFLALGTPLMLDAFGAFTYLFYLVVYLLVVNFPLRVSPSAHNSAAVRLITKRTISRQYRLLK